MKKKHQVDYWYWTSEDVSFMANLGLKVKENECSYFILDEDDKYERIRDRFSDRRFFRDIVFYEYSKDDVFSSEYCVMNPIGGGGYPQPESKWWELKSEVYDLSGYCWECGSQKVQMNSFRINRISRRPVWGFTAWEYDVLFTTEDFYREVFESLGITYRTVRKASGKIYPGVLQLVIPVIDEDLDLSMHTDRKICPVCGRVKYGAKDLTPFFSLQDNPLPHIFLTKEYFGYGHEAYHRIVLSKELVRIFLKNKVIRFDNLIPCRKNLAEYLRTIKY